jgi:hypothetical protein
MSDVRSQRTRRAASKFSRQPPARENIRSVGCETHFRNAGHACHHSQARYQLADVEVRVDRPLRRAMLILPPKAHYFSIEVRAGLASTRETPANRRAGGALPCEA